MDVSRKELGLGKAYERQAAVLQRKAIPLDRGTLTTLGDLTDAFLNHTRATRKDRTCATYASRLDLFAQYLGGSKGQPELRREGGRLTPLASIGPGTTEDFLDKRSRQRSSGTVAGDLRVLKSTLSSAVRRGALRATRPKLCRGRGRHPDASVHSLGHTYASALLRRGGPQYTGQRLLGHSDPKTTQRCSHVRQQDFQEATAQLSFGQTSSTDNR